MRLMDGLYCYIWQGKGNNCNSYIIGGEVLTLIDPGHIANELREPCLDRLFASMEKDGFRPEDITLIINTHCHPDHFEANKFFAERTKAKIAFSKEEEKSLGEMYNFQGMTPSYFKPSFYLKEGTLNLGKSAKISLEIFHTPGHSPGSICIYWAEKKVLFSGDLVFTASVGVTDHPWGSSSQLKRSIEKVSKLDIEYLLPGHTEIVAGKENVERNFALIKRYFFGV